MGQRPASHPGCAGLEAEMTDDERRCWMNDGRTVMLKPKRGATGTSMWIIQRDSLSTGVD